MIRRAVRIFFCSVLATLFSVDAIPQSQGYLATPAWLDAHVEVYRLAPNGRGYALRLIVPPEKRKPPCDYPPFEGTRHAGVAFIVCGNEPGVCQNVIVYSPERCTSKKAAAAQLESAERTMRSLAMAAPIEVRSLPEEGHQFAVPADLTAAFGFAEGILFEHRRLKGAGYGVVASAPGFPSVAVATEQPEELGQMLGEPLVARDPPLLLLFSRSSCCPNYPNGGTPVWLRPLGARLFTERARQAVTSGKAEEASRDLAKALELAPNEPEALYLQAVAYAKLGRTQDARMSLEQALKLGPRSLRHRVKQDPAFEPLRKDPQGAPLFR